MNLHAKALRKITEAEEALKEARCALECMTHDHHAPPEGEWVRADTITPFSSDFDVNDWLEDTRVMEVKPESTRGAFRGAAQFSHLAYDDPIVFPGEPGRAHLHMFAGNRLTDAHSTYESLRENPANTTSADMLNGSAYWIPALLNGHGMAVVPSIIHLYYKHWSFNGVRAPLPTGLRALMTEKRFSIKRPGEADPAPSSTENLGDILTEARAGDVIRCRISAGLYWDGLHIDSPDHLSHLSHKYDQEKYPYIIPRHSQDWVFQVHDGDDPRDFRFSSDDEMGAAIPGETFHGDFMEAWHPEAWRLAQETVLDVNGSTSNFTFGNGKRGKKWPGFTWSQTEPHLVPVPPRPEHH